MNISVRTKYFLSSLLLILIVVLASGIYLENRLKNWLKPRIETELKANVYLARQLVERAVSAGTLEIWDSLADSISGSVGSRITIIAQDGAVIGDSDLTPVEVEAVENHGNRREVIQALNTGIGISRRYSTTIGTEMLYIAVPYTRSDGSGVIRISRPLFELDSILGRLRGLLLVAGTIALAAALFLGWFLAQAMSRTLRIIADEASAISSGETSLRIITRSRDELGGLAGSFNRIAEELEKTITELSEERNLFEAVLDSMNEAVIAIDPQHRITMVNRGAVSLLRLDKSPVGGTLMEAVRSPLLEDLVMKSLQGMPASAEFDLPGTPSPRLLARATPLKATSGSVIVILDVTELRRLERVRRDFFANVSHELRTPVSVIRANAETLLDGAAEDPKNGRRFLQSILKDSERLSNLVSDLLDLSRIEGNGYRPDSVIIPVLKAVEGAVRSVKKTADSKGQKIEVEINEDLTVHADPQGFEQILLNLLNNAVRHTPKECQIAVKAEPVNDGVRIEVADDGPGIEPQHRDRLFERFYRVDEGRSREEGGTGLGLSIVKHLVESMGGRVGYEPSLPHGSVFWIILPVPSE